ncbi:chemerin-like receptor 1 [Spea bombifrons]|uniref:chemerin-like receptor 1 n=1 Tax=Spea bombifrons TaxID=233779 RepID=UPI00234AD445|nr:chemerin-like receptor 1 [Spea bombifrons]
MATEDPFLSYIDNATTDPAPKEAYYNYYVELVKIISIIGYSITFVLGVVGNGLVIWIAGFKMKRMVNTIWYLNLGVADFTFDLFLPLLITQWALDGHWPFGWIMCKVINTVLFLNMTVSTSFLMIISIDRCVSVVCPVWSKNHRSPRLAIIVSIIVWLLCLTLSSPYLAVFDIVESETNKSYCFALYSVDSHKAMLLTRLVSMFIVPFFIILVCYGIIIIRLRRSRNLSVSNRPFKVIVSIVFCFFCCWFPFHFCPLFVYLDTTWETDLIVYYLSICLAYFNSCLNPILYVFIGHDFKKSLIRSIPFLLESTFRERCDCNSENQGDQTVMGTELESYNA